MEGGRLPGAVSCACHQQIDRRLRAKTERELESARAEARKLKQDNADLQVGALGMCRVCVLCPCGVCMSFFCVYVC